MRTIVAGSRDITDYEIVKKAIEESGFTITTLISGNARGVDRLGEQWAEENNIPIERYPVTKQEWDTIGKSAGHKRNAQMANVAEALIAIWDGNSPGTRNMIDLAKRKNLKVHVWML